jgi:hypothetical protein
MPARHTSLHDDLLQDDLLLEADFNRWLWSTKEGVGETSGQAAGSYFRRVRSLKNRSRRRNKFSSFGADFWSAISPAAKPQVKSGPDVFADALVLPKPEPVAPGAPIFPKSPEQLPVVIIRESG